MARLPTALDLFTEQGYDATTVAQIAEGAGITRSTFVRYFPDKRDLLAAGQETLSQLLVEGIADAPEGATPLETVAAGLQRASGAMGPVRTASSDRASRQPSPPAPSSRNATASRTSASRQP